MTTALSRTACRLSPRRLSIATSRCAHSRTRTCVRSACGVRARPTRSSCVGVRARRRWWLRRDTARGASVRAGWRPPSASRAQGRGYRRAPRPRVPPRWRRPAVTPRRRRGAPASRRCGGWWWGRGRRGGGCRGERLSRWPARAFLSVCPTPRHCCGRR